MLSSSMDGVNAVQASLEGASRLANRRAGEVVRKTITDIQADARRLAPVDTGALRSSITSEVRMIPGGVEGVAGPTVHYGRYVEEGTSRHAPQAFMGPALDRHTPTYIDALADAVGRI